MAVIEGTDGRDRLVGGAEDDSIYGFAGNDKLVGGAGNDFLVGGLGNDSISGGSGDDTVNLDVSTDGADRINLGIGNDRINILGSEDVTTVRLTFASGDVGNGSSNDSDNTGAFDGGFAIRIQAEDAMGELTGDVSRADDEGTLFVGAPGLAFDIRDLLTDAERGNIFNAAYFGTSAADMADYSAYTGSMYANGGLGDDTIMGGIGADVLEGGIGNDTLVGGDGNDTFIGGAGRDSISGGAGDDTVQFNYSNSGVDRANLGLGNDFVRVSSDDSTSQVRLTFTSAEVGNGDAADSGTLANQDGALAVRMQLEDGNDGLTGEASRFDDEGITFLAGAGTTFDVRDLVSGTQRGDQFTSVTLGTNSDDFYDFTAGSLTYYVNGGAGNDKITGGDGKDFLVGGAGDDILDGGAGRDLLLGGAGADTFVFADEGKDAIVDFVSGTDKIDLTAFGITTEDVSITMRGDNSLLKVDVDGDGTFDLRVTVQNADVAVSDLVF